MAESENAEMQHEYKLDYKDAAIDTVEAEVVNLHQCTVNSVNGKVVKMNQSGAIFVAGEEIKCEKSGSVLLVAQEVHGDCRPIISVPAALIVAGAILFGIALFKRK